MRHLPRWAALVIAATFSLHAAGCESASTPSHPAASTAKPSGQVSQQLIVKFKPKSVACTVQGITRFSKASGVPLDWLRPMSGDACVVVQSAANPKELSAGQERLKKHSEIEWVDIDAVMERH